MIGQIYLVLQSTHKKHKKQQVFVDNRAAKILKKSSTDQWRLVKDIKNPSDIGTREMVIEGLKKSGWLNWPAWLQTEKKE